MAHPYRRALVGEAHLRGDILPRLQIAGTQRTVMLLRIRIEIDEVVVADPERGRSLDPEAFRRKRR